MNNKKIVIGITGASGSIYAIRLIEELYKMGYFIHLVLSREGRSVVAFELEDNIENLIKFIKKNNKCSGKIELFDNEDLFAPIASGSYKIDSVIILPCSMNTIAAISIGISDTLLLRACQVILKENKKLFVVPREMPYNEIMLDNLLTLAKLGVKIIPASPGFYNKPKNIEDLINFVIGKILDIMMIENNVYKRWKGNK